MEQWFIRAERMDAMYKYEVFTANNEEPNCMRCDYVTDSVYEDLKGKKHDRCVEHCGPEHGWNAYRRTEEIERKRA